MNDTLKRFAFKPDTLTKKIGMFSYKDTRKKSYFTYSFPGKNLFLMTGKWNNDSVSIEMEKYDIGSFCLVYRGFHWINESPYNR